MELLSLFFRPHYGPVFDSTSTSKRNKYQGYVLRGKGGQCMGLTTLPPSLADFIEIQRALKYWISNGLSRPVMGQLYT